MNTSHAQPPLAVLWDFGGVILSSPFEAFRLYERTAGIPEDFIRMLNARNPDTNAWAKMERSDVSLAEFVILFEAEAEAHGHQLDGWQVLKAISGDIRPQMVEALRRCKAAFRVACITNNMKSGEGPGMARSPEKAAAVAEVMTLFEHVVEFEQARLPQARPAHLPACLRADRRAAGALRLSRRPRHQSEAGQGAGHAAPSRSAIPTSAIAELEAIVGIPLRDATIVIPR